MFFSPQNTKNSGTKAYNFPKFLGQRMEISSNFIKIYSYQRRMPVTHYIFLRKCFWECGNDGGNALKFCFHLKKSSAEAYEAYRRLMKSLFFPVTYLEGWLVCVRKEDNQLQRKMDWITSHCVFKSQHYHWCCYCHRRSSNNITSTNRNIARIIAWHPHVGRRKTEHETFLCAVVSETPRNWTTGRSCAVFFSIDGDNTGR